MSASNSKLTVLKIDDAGGTARDFSGLIKSTDLDIEAGEIDTTVLNADSKSVMGGLLSGSGSLEGDFDQTAYGYLRGALGMVVDYELSPLGTGTGKPKESGQVLIKKVSISSGVGEAVKMKCELELSGDTTPGTH